MVSKRIWGFIKNSGILIIGSKLQMIILFLKSIVVARGLGVDKYGQWAVVIAVTAILLDLFRFKTQWAMGKYIVELKNENNLNLLKKILKKSLLLEFFGKSIGSLLVLSSVVVIIKYFNGPENYLVYIFYMSATFFDFIGPIWFVIERDQKNFKNIAIVSCIRSFLVLFFVLIFFELLNFKNLYFLALAFLLSSLIIFIYKMFRVNFLLNLMFKTNLYELVRFKYDSKDEYSMKILNEFKNFIKTTYLSNFISSFIKKIDIILAGYFFAPQIVGLMRLAKNLANIFQSFTKNFTKAIYQDFNELIVEKKEKKLNIVLKKYLKIFIPILAIAFLIVGFLSHPIINFLYGIQYKESYFYLYFYLIYSFIELGGFWLNPLLLALKGWRFKLITLSLSLLIGLISIVFFKSVFGAIGIVIGFIIIRLYINSSFLIYILQKLRN